MKPASVNIIGAGQCGTTAFLRYGQKADEQIYSVTRLGLNQVLLGVADQIPNVQLNFQQNAIADMALDNYIEMRDTVRDPKFALRKALAEVDLEKAATAVVSRLQPIASIRSAPTE